MASLQYQYDRKFSRSQILEQRIPPILKPLVRAYVLGYASSVTPKLLGLFLTHIGRKRRTAAISTSGDQSESHFIPALLRILKGGLELQRFPTFCAAICGTSTFLEIPLGRLIKRLLPGASTLLHLRLSKLTSAFIAGWLSLELLHSKKETVTTASGLITRSPEFAGRTIDLTLFAVTRAADVIVGDLWHRRKSRRVASGRWSQLDNVISSLADSAIFVASSALVMWAWIYHSDRLPRSYNKWIKSAAMVDDRLIDTLRRMRNGEMAYGVDRGASPRLESMCIDHGWPLEWANFGKNIPMPCEVVHMKDGVNCEYHALARFVRSFIWALSTYVPLNFILIVRNPSKKALRRALTSAIRSSSFLGTFIALYYYGVCLVRTRVGPRMLGHSLRTHQMLDEGPCIAGGCLLCGWSVLIENAGRRKELGLFVAPRAFATVMPRKYSLKYQWRETMAFAMSTAIVFTAVREKPERVRGVLGKVLKSVLVY